MSPDTALSYNEHAETVDDDEHGVFEQLSAAAARGLGRQQAERAGGPLQLAEVAARARRRAAGLLRRRARAVSGNITLSIFSFFLVKSN